MKGCLRDASPIGAAGVSAGYLLVGRMIELRRLRSFAVTCRHPSLARAAAELGVAPSTLSTSLKSLERELGTALFRRSRSGLYPMPSALWLYRAAATVMQMEAFGRRLMQPSKRHESGLLTVEIRLPFTFGRINNALNQAVEAFARACPRVMLDLRWRADSSSDLVAQLSQDLALARRGRVVIDVIAGAAELANHDTVLVTDRWALGCRLPTGTNGPPPAAHLFAGPVIVPALPDRLINQLEAYLRSHEIAGVRFGVDRSASLSMLFSEHPEAAALAPESLFSRQLGLSRVKTIPLDPSLVTTIVARIEEPDPIARTFIERLRDALHASRRDQRRHALIGSRKIRYFNLLYRTRGVSIAAQAAKIAQPAMSDQLHELEAALRVRLFDRRNDGLVPTVDGERFAPVAAAIERGLETILLAGRAAQRRVGSRLSLGILPSVNQHGYLVNKVTEAVLAVQSRHLQLKIVVAEGPNETLQRWVLEGLVGIAIVDIGLPNMPRLPLSAPERLAAIAHPRHALLPEGPVALATLATVPLALPGSLFGLRQVLDAASRERGLTVSPHIEIDGLAMLIAVLSREPMCTVLPPSAVQRELDAGELVAHPIVEPEICRKLFVIYSADRSLTEPERDLVSTLQAGLASPPTEATRASSPPSVHARHRR